MIKTSDLRRGNIVFPDDGEYYPYATIDFILQDSIGIGQDSYDIGAIKPVPLTEEWLLRLGFEKGEEKKRNGNGYDYQPKEVYTIWTDYTLGDFRYKISRWHWSGGIENEDCAIWYDNSLIKCDYVHQLQNIYFALTGEELDIKA